MAVLVGRDRGRLRPGTNAARLHRDPEPHQPRVVVGVGESGSSSAALAWSLDLCRRRGWLLDVVTAGPDMDQVPVHEVRGHYCLSRGRAVAALDAALAACGVGPHDPDVVVEVVNDDPVRDSCRVRSSCPVVVVGHTSGGSAARGQPPAATGSP